MQTRARGRGKGGFTLIELTVVIFILSLLFGFGIGVITRMNPAERGFVGIVRSRLVAAHNTSRSMGVPCWVRLLHGTGQESGYMWMQLATVRPLLSFSFADQGRGAYGLHGDIQGGLITPRGRFGNGLIHPESGLPGMEVATVDREYLNPTNGFLLRLDLCPTARQGMTLFSWGLALELTVDRSGCPTAKMILLGKNNMPGDRVELASPIPLALNNWVTLEVTFDGKQLSLGVGGRVLDRKEAPGQIYYKSGVPIIISGGREPVAGILDEVQLLSYNMEEPELLPENLEKISGPDLMRFIPGGSLDPKLHPGGFKLEFKLPSGNKQDLLVSAKGLVQ